MLRQPDSINRLQAAGFSYEDACALRRISMTLHRWHELECGDSNAYASWSIVRGRFDVRTPAVDGHRALTYDDNGWPYIERHVHTENRARYESIPDREAGAKRRLAAIMARYPGYRAYIQSDPRGCALFILTPETLARWPADQDLSTIYSSGIAVYK